MNWTEELKMSIRKTARKGRRSKSRDVPLSTISSQSLETSSKSNDAANDSTSSNKQNLAIDIKLDLELQGSALGDNKSQNRSIANAGIEKDLKDTKPPNNLRRISGKWTNSGFSKNSKFKKGSLDDAGLSLKSLIKTPPIALDDIPSIPDIDELNNEIDKPLAGSDEQPTATSTSHSDQILNNILANADGNGLNLLCLTKCLQPINTIYEPDEVWDIDRMFIDVMAEINAETVQIQLADVQQKKPEFTNDPINSFKAIANTQQK